MAGRDQGFDIKKGNEADKRIGLSAYKVRLIFFKKKGIIMRYKKTKMENNFTNRFSFFSLLHRAIRPGEHVLSEDEGQRHEAFARLNEPSEGGSED